MWSSWSCVFHPHMLVAFLSLFDGCRPELTSEKFWSYSWLICLTNHHYISIAVWAVGVDCRSNGGVVGCRLADIFGGNSGNCESVGWDRWDEGSFNSSPLQTAWRECSQFLSLAFHQPLWLRGPCVSWSQQPWSWKLALRWWRFWRWSPGRGWPKSQQTPVTEKEDTYVNHIKKQQILFYWQQADPHTQLTRTCIQTLCSETIYTRLSFSAKVCWFNTLLSTWNAVYVSGPDMSHYTSDMFLNTVTHTSN